MIVCSLMTISVVSGLGLLTRDAIAVESVSTMMLMIVGSRQVVPSRRRKEGRFTRCPPSRRGTEAQDPDSQVRLAFLASCGEAW